MLVHCLLLSSIEFHVGCLLVGVVSEKYCQYDWPAYYTNVLSWCRPVYYHTDCQCLPQIASHYLANMEENCQNCTNNQNDTEDGPGASMGVVIGGALGTFFFLIIALSVCYAKRWLCFAVRYIFLLQL